MQISLFRRATAAFALTSILSSCGGGGGGGGGFAALPTAATATVTLSGVATYDAISNPNGALVYASVAAKPVRGAAVEVINATSAVLASPSATAQTT